MNLFIIRWNPNISSYKKEDHLELINHIKNNEQPTVFNWSIREYEKLHKDDMFILQQVGTDNDGIAMIGRFKDDCYEDDSWKNDGSKLYYADMWIMDAFDCDNENPLPAKRYEELFPEIQWHGGHSGVVVEEDLDDKLVNQVEADLIKAGIWKESDLDDFMAWDFEKENNDKILLSAKEMYLKEKTQESFVNFVCCLKVSKVLMPMHVETDENGDDKCFPMLITNDIGESVFPIFSNEEQIDDGYKDDDCEFYEISVPLAAEIIKDDKDTVGIILDPFTNPFLIDRELADLISELKFADESEENQDNK